MNALTLGLIAALCWGLHDITIRYLSRTVPLLAALLTVLIIGALFQAFVLVGTQSGFALSKTGLAYSFAAGLCFLIASLGLYYAFERGPVRLVAPTIASYPILSMIFAAWAGRDIAPLDYAAVGLIVLGVGIVAALSDDDAGNYPPIGATLALALVSAIGFASTFKLGQLAATVDGEIATTLVTRLTALVLLALIITGWRKPAFPGLRALAPLAAMGVLDGIALLAVISAADLANPEYASVASSVFGMLTVILAWLFLKERMQAVQWFGCLIAFVGIAYLAL